MKIMHCWNGATLFDAPDAQTVKDAVLAALKAHADLRDADLGNANLRGADLGNANLRDADLRDADLGNANLRDANLGNANLRDANLGNANLRDADLGNADLRDADLGNANLRGADLGNANLGNANLRDADLGNANLRDANLGNANLGNANLRGARIETGETLDEYVRETAPALLAAGGKPVPAESWTCHSWRSGALACPMAAAFGIASSDQAPRLLRPRVEQFVRLFDAGVIHGPPDAHGHLRLAPVEAPARGATGGDGVSTGNEPFGLREELAWFAGKMERELRENDHKGHWRSGGFTPAQALRRLREEADELAGAIAREAPVEEIISEAADVANFAMMVADLVRCAFHGVLPAGDAPTQPPTPEPARGSPVRSDHGAAPAWDEDVVTRMRNRMGQAWRDIGVGFSAGIEADIQALLDHLTVLRAQLAEAVCDREAARESQLGQPGVPRATNANGQYWRNKWIEERGRADRNANARALYEAEREFGRRLKAERDAALAAVTRERDEAIADHADCQNKVVAMAKGGAVYIARAEQAEAERDALRAALTHMIDEIEGQVQVGTLSRTDRENRTYWMQVVGVGRAALSGAPAPVAAPPPPEGGA